MITLAELVSQHAVVTQHAVVALQPEVTLAELVSQHAVVALQQEEQERRQQQPQRRRRRQRRQRSYWVRKVKTNASKCLQMSYGHYKCLVINKNGLRLLKKIFPGKFLEHVSNIRNTCERPQMLTNTYEGLAITF